MTTESMVPIAPCINAYTPKTKTVSIPFCGSANLMEDIPVLNEEVTKETVLNLYLQAGVYVTTPEPVEMNQCKTVVLHAAKAINPSVQDTNNIPRYEIKKDKTIAEMPYFVEYILTREFLTNKRSLLLIASVNDEIDEDIDEDIDDDGYSHNAYTYHCSVVLDSPAILEHKDRAIRYPLDTATLREILRKNTYVDAENSDDIIEGLLPYVWDELDKLVDDILSGESQTTSIAIYNPENGLLKLNLPVVHSSVSNTTVSDVLTKLLESPKAREMFSNGWSSNFFNINTAKFAFSSIVQSLNKEITTEDLNKITNEYFPSLFQPIPLQPAQSDSQTTSITEVPENILTIELDDLVEYEIFKNIPKFETFLEDDNLINEYMQYFLKCSGGYPVVKYLCCIVGLSMITDRKIVAPHRFGKTYPNICSLIIGPSGITHKSASIDEIEGILCTVFGSDKFISEYSKEGLFDALSMDSHICLINDEIGGLLSEMHNKNGYMSAIADALCSVFDCKDKYRRKLRKEIIEIYDTFVTCLWSTTTSRFQETCTIRDVQSGFLARELIGTACGPYIKSLMGREREEDVTEWNRIADRFNELHNLISSITHIDMVFSGDAYKTHQCWYDDKMKDTTNEVQLAVAVRLSNYVFKISIINYMASRSFIEDVEAAKATQGLSIVLQIPDIYVTRAMQVVYGYFFSVAMALFNDTSKHAPDSLTTRVLDKIKSAPDMTISRGELHAALGGRVTKNDLDEVITMLVQSNVITTSTVMNFTGKRNQGYFTEYYQYIGKGVHLNDSKCIKSGGTVYVDKDGNVIKDAEKRIQANEAAAAKKQKELEKMSKIRAVANSKK